MTLLTGNFSEETVRSRREAFYRVESALGLLDNMKLPKVYSGLNREELYLDGLERAAAITNDMLDYGHRHFEFLNERYQLSNATPFGLHFLMFRKTIELQGTPEQKAYWLPLIDKMQINGAYAQTELAHGSHVRGLETTATFDPKTDEFVINSPTLTSTKYWPGAIGLSCSHAVVMARLITQGKDYGIHPFVVQFRSLEDFSPMPGVELGDIGIKMAYNGTCNGYARFNNVRIPRDALLMAYAQVLRDGSYVRSSYQDVAYSKLAYATMLYNRAVITRATSFSLAQALTITARYSTVREQGQGMNASLGNEVALVTYKSQNYRLLTLISQACAILFASKDLDQHCRTLIQQQKDGNHSRLPFTHALCCGMKAWSTTLACAGVEEARRMCGGHGYVAMSGLPEILAAVSATVTFEGENYVLWQQLVRYLFQRVDALYAGKKIEPDLDYLARGFPTYFVSGSPSRCTASGAQLLEPDTLLAIFRHRSLRVLAVAHHKFTQAIRRDQMSKADAWNKHMMEILHAGRAYVEYVALNSFYDRIRLVEPSLQPVLMRLAALFALTTITNPNASGGLSFVEDGHLSLDQLDTMREHVDDLLAQLCPDIIALTDAWDFTDGSLCSALGAKDGNVYERLMAWTRQLPVNQHAQEQGGMLVEPWEQEIKPMLRARL